jgi:FtsZ-interacting cell division protein ZipA
VIGPAAVLVLVIGVLVVLAVAVVALVLDARRRRARQVPPAPSRPPVPRRQTEPIDSARAQVDPPTVMTRADQVPPPEQDGGTREGR